jgi:hypothetical protein
VRSVLTLRRRLTAIQWREIAGTTVRLVIQAVPEFKSHLRFEEIHRALSPVVRLDALVDNVERSARRRLGSRDVSELGLRELLWHCLEIKTTDWVGPGTPGPDARNSIGC